MNGLHIAFDSIHRNFVRLVNTVPNTEVLSVLSDNDIRVGNPADILAVVEKRLFLLLFDIVEVELLAFVAEE